MAESKWFHKTETLAEFETLITSLEDEKKKIADYQDSLVVYVFFHGAHDSTTGKSWCPVCVKGTYKSSVLDGLLNTEYSFYFVRKPMVRLSIHFVFVQLNHLWNKL